jgi:hypothetical protein
VSTTESPGGRPDEQPPASPPSYPAPSYPAPSYAPPAYPAYPAGPPGYPAAASPDGPMPKALRPVLGLLLLNLALSIGLTIAVLILHNSVIDYQLAHEHITDPARRTSLRHSYQITLWSRVAGNIVLSVVYAFLVRALLRGRRWAYRRVILIAAFGILSLLILLGTPYPTWVRTEQIVQAAVLAAMLFFVLRPEVRAHFAAGLPGRDVRRFRQR